MPEWCSFDQTLFLWHGTEVKDSRGSSLGKGLVPRSAPAVSLNQPEPWCSTGVHCVLNEPWRAGGLMVVWVKKVKGWGKKALLCASGWGEKPSTTFYFHPPPLPTPALALLSFWTSTTNHKVNGAKMLLFGLILKSYIKGNNAYIKRKIIANQF